MDAQILRELEIAAQILLASPNLVTHEQRQAAESVFYNFKKTDSPYILCKYILETTKVDYVLFEVASLLKDALIREWTVLQQSDIASLRQYLLQYVIERSGTIPLFVREKILQVISIMVKRGSLEDNGAHRSLLLNETENLIMNGDHSKQLLGCGLLAALVQEYDITSKSTDIGLTWALNAKAKKDFEGSDLKRIFQFCCKALNSLTNTGPPYQEETLSLLKQLLAISESILTWDLESVFLGKFDVCRLNRSTPLKLTFMGQDDFLESQIINLFFMIYWKIRSNPQLSHHALTCLVQIASLKGTFFESKESGAQFLANYVEGFVKLVQSFEILDREALGISNIVLKLLLCFPPLLWMELPTPLLQSFFERFAILTCNFAEGAAKEETICADDRLYMEAFDHMMEAWLEVLRDPLGLGKDYIVGALVQIFNVYLKCHLAPPEGTRGQGRDLELEELNESDETDRIKFKNQLQTIGEFGRHCPEHCLPLLSRLLEDRTKMLSRFFFDRLNNQQSGSIPDSNSLVLVFEDIHWLLLLAGNVMSVGILGETPIIPTGLMKYSIAQSSSTSIEVSLQVFGSPNLNLEEIQDAELKTDHVIRLVSSVFRLSYLFKRFIEAKMIQFLSPEVVCSMLWFFKNWSQIYLLLNEQLNRNLSMPFVCAFGRDSEGGVWAVNYLLEQVVTYLIHFSSEPGVTQDAVDLFLSLVDSKEKGICVLKSENLMNIIKIQANLPLEVKRDVVKGLTLAGVALQDAASRNEYWQQTIKPLQDKLQLILRQENFKKIFHDENVKTEILDILECMIGITMGTHPNTLPSVFQYLSPMFSELPTLMEAYHNYQQIVELILMLLCKSAEYLIRYLSTSEKKKLYEDCLKTVQAYAKCNSGRLSLASDSQDDSFTDILLLMEFFTNLFDKIIVSVWVTKSPEEEGHIVEADVCLYGLNIVMPLMTVDLLKYPALCLQYFKLIACMCEFYPEKICVLPENLLKPLLSSIELGLTSFGQEIIPLCCGFIQILGSHIATMAEGGEAPHQALKPFLKLLMNLILSNQFSADLLPHTSSALFSLICCYQEEYQSIVQSFLAAQTDPVVRDRLAEAFFELTRDLPLKCGRQNRGQRNGQKFRRKFETFIISVRGYFPGK